MANKTIFLTGFPGFIAGRLLENLVKDADSFFLLVQKQFTQKAFELVNQISRERKIPIERFQIIEGDITKDNLGIQQEKLDIIKQEVTDVFHLAAIYDLEVKKEPAYMVNVEGTRNVNKFVKSLPKLNRYNYVSTCYVAGKREGLILETELEHNAGFRNFYEETKYLAEIEVEKLKKEVPTTIFRPSVVVGDSKTGETAKYDGIYYLIHYYRIFPSLLRIFNVGNKKVRLNLVPVDFVVDAMYALSKDEASIGKTLALADPNPLTTKEICDVIVKAITGKNTLITPPEALVKWTLNLPFSPAITGLPHAGVPYFFISQTYDTSIASSFLAKHGISCPRFSDYIKNLVDFVEKKPKL